MFISWRRFFCRTRGVHVTHIVFVYHKICLCSINYDKSYFHASQITSGSIYVKLNLGSASCAHAPQVLFMYRDLCLCNPDCVCVSQTVLMHHKLHLWIPRCIQGSQIIVFVYPKLSSLWHVVFVYHKSNFVPVFLVRVVPMWDRKKQIRDFGNPCVLKPTF